MRKALQSAGKLLPYFLVFLGLLMLAASVVVAIAFSGKASAEPQSGRDKTFLSLLSSAGITFKNPQDAIAEAHTICRQLDGGKWTKEDIIGIAVEIKKANPSLELSDIGSMIGAALTSYCPGNIPDWFYDEVINGDVDKPGDIKRVQKNGEPA